jgi:hypothetical protein
MPVGARREQAARRASTSARVRGSAGNRRAGFRLNGHQTVRGPVQCRFSKIPTLYASPNPRCAACARKTTLFCRSGRRSSPLGRDGARGSSKTARRGVGRTPWWSRAVDWLAVQRAVFQGRFPNYSPTGRSRMPPTISSATAIRFASSAARRSGRTERPTRSTAAPEKRLDRLGSHQPSETAPRSRFIPFRTTGVDPMGQQAIAATPGAARGSPWTQEAG